MVPKFSNTIYTTSLYRPEQYLHNSFLDLVLLYQNTFEQGANLFLLYYPTTILLQLSARHYKEIFFGLSNYLLLPILKFQSFGFFLILSTNNATTILIVATIIIIISITTILKSNNFEPFENIKILLRNGLGV